MFMLEHLLGLFLSRLRSWVLEILLPFPAIGLQSLVQSLCL